MSRTRLPKQVINELKALPVLHGCPAAELAVVDRHTTHVRVARGATLCREGQPGRDAFIILSGQVDVAVGDVSVATLEAGSFCGEMALIERGVRSATVTAVTEMELLAMSVSDFTSILDSAPSVARRVLALLSARLRHVLAEQALQSVSSTTTESREPPARSTSALTTILRR